MSFLYSDNFFPGLVFVTPFTSVVLLKPTRPPNPQSWVNHRFLVVRQLILKLRRSQHADTAHRLAIKGFRWRFFFALPFTCKFPTGYSLQATTHRTEHTSFVQIDTQHPSPQFDNDALSIAVWRGWHLWQHPARRHQCAAEELLEPR